jgi:ABC-2 type transport system ATP-binding protein
MKDVSRGILVEGLTRRFRDVVAVDAIDFVVAPGELFGLVGPDGAGKTTTLRMLAGVMRPSAGDARVGGISVARDPERVKDRIAYMPQRFGLYADLTVMENILFFADLYRVPRRDRPARIERLFRFSNLAPFADRLAGRLSGGMKQKLALSCALIHQPEILLLDEPTFGVDPISRRDLWLIVHEMVHHGTTVLVSTAYMDEAERFDRLALLNRGKILSIGAPADLQKDLPGEILAIRLEHAREARATALQHPAVLGAAVFGDRLHVTVASAARDGAAIAEHLRAAGFAVIGAETIEPSMEDVFIERIERIEREVRA